MGEPVRPPRRVPLQGVLLLATAMLCSACASESDRKEAELTMIEHWLPGHYDTHPVTEGTGTVPQSFDVALTIVPVQAMLLGKRVFYAEEISDDASHRTLGHRIIAFDVVNGQIVESVLVLTDPQRWRGGAQNPELFTALQPPDLRSIRGCALSWKKEGMRFAGVTERFLCRTPSFGGGGGAGFVETRIELEPDDITITDRITDGHGRPLPGGAARDSALHFRRTG
jgi:hypothetical protein